jgi:hypothetical protein
MLFQIEVDCKLRLVLLDVKPNAQTMKCSHFRQCLQMYVSPILHKLYFPRLNGFEVSLRWFSIGTNIFYFKIGS